ncbi:MAG: hypothetical protein JXP34_20740 [Planctomycetes bacterium]|nr:hypothetical protein [Planctomycetota bacterium]
MAPVLKAKTGSLQGPEILEIREDHIEVRRSCFYYEENRRLRLDEIAAMSVSRRPGSSWGAATAFIGVLCFVFAAALIEEPRLETFRIVVAIAGAALIAAAAVLTIRGVDVIQFISSDGYTLRFLASGSRARRDHLIEKIARAIRERRASERRPT